MAWISLECALILTRLLALLCSPHRGWFRFKEASVFKRKKDDLVELDTSEDLNLAVEDPPAKRRRNDCFTRMQMEPTVQELRDMHARNPRGQWTEVGDSAQLFKPTRGIPSRELL